MKQLYARESKFPKGTDLSKNVSHDFVKAATSSNEAFETSNVDKNDDSMSSSYFTTLAFLPLCNRGAIFQQKCGK